jgi:hypothetical protein
MLAKVANMLTKKNERMVMATTDHLKLRSSAASRENEKWIRNRAIIRLFPATASLIIFNTP